MNATYDCWPYWSLDLPGLSQAKAQELLGMAERAGMSFGGTLVDPAQFLTLHVDRPTVEVIRDVLSRRRESSDMASQSDGVMINGFIELLEEWLSDSPED
jgi:hypothetical protein